MTNNCLVTKLKSSVDNDALPKVGDILFKRLASTNESAINDQFIFSVSSMAYGQSVTISAEEGGYFVLDPANMYNPSYRLTSKTITSSDGSVILYMANMNFRIRVSNKYALNQFRLATGTSAQVNLTDFGYCGLMTVFSVREMESVYGDINKLLENGLLTSLTLTAVHSTIKTSSLAKCVGLTTATLGSITFEGDLSQLSPLTSLNNVNFGGSKISGDINTLAQAMWNNGSGRTQGTLTMYCADTGITYNGNPFSKATITFSNNAPVINVS